MNRTDPLVTAIHYETIDKLMHKQSNMYMPCTLLYTLPISADGAKIKIRKL